MATLDWKKILRDHPLFGDLGEDGIDALLRTYVSQEKRYVAHDVILEEGETGNALYLLGAGEVSVVLKHEKEHLVAVAELPKGEIFGEMALLENQPRSATIEAKSDCVVLEINGDEFLKILHDHPAIEFKFMAKLSERLRHVTSEILVKRLNDLNEKFNLHKREVDIELNVARTSIAAAEQTLDTANKRMAEISERAKEVIEGTNRSQENILKSVRIVGLVGGVALIALGAYGYTEFRDVTLIKDKFEANLDFIEKRAGEVESAAENAQKELVSLQDKRKEMQFYTDVFAPKFYKSFIVEDVFWDELQSGRYEEARGTFSALLALRQSDVSEALFKEILRGIMERDSRELIIEFLNANLDSMQKFTPGNRFLIYYLILGAYIVAEDLDSYEELLSGDFQRQVERYKNTSIKGELPFLEDYGPSAFQEYFEAEIMDKEITAIEKDSNGKVDTEAIDKILEDETIEERAAARTKKIKDVWDQIP